ncbi:hypothetical protein SAMN05428985_110186 [Nocardioides sp. YR527]|uniref:hypothetical protein n=1 Tax=Nocardioides sp. YR527 TaxID=1881028 RepID=UPI000881AD3B|nr:hypothetical protein [Nocardioides sp. YR527]SDL17364.1 hypothetical protein SAMN05428985_110186 [Nocardioides sp. YR527]
MTPRQQQAQAFYAARDKRTAQYGAEEGALNRPIVLSVDEVTAADRPAQVAILALVDMLFRVHRKVRLDLPDVTMATGERLEDVAIAAAFAIDPFQRPKGLPVDGEVRLHLTTTGSSEAADVMGTWNGGRAEVHIRGAGPLGAEAARHSANAGHTDVLGAATTACLVAAAAFAMVHGREPTPAAINLLTRTSGIGAGTDSAIGPLDVGNVDVIGGGAVGHALTYWANVFGVIGTWNVIDGDDAEIHNTNRCAGMTVADAGWPNGVPVGVARKKAETAARNNGSRATTAWFHELPAERPRPDLLLVLANEHGVRDAVAQRGEPLLLHATTSANWTAELHRHIPGRDDCPACRLPTKTQASFACSEGHADPTDGQSGDAALPFLSAASGLLLCAALLDLRTDRHLLEGRDNHWLAHLELPLGSPIQSAIHRGTTCVHHLPPRARKTIQAAQPRRWDHIDDLT